MLIRVEKLQEKEIVDYNNCLYTKTKNAKNFKFIIDITNDSLLMNSLD